MASPPLPAGKLPAPLLDELLSSLPAPPPEVLVGPRVGEDACVLEMPEPVLVAATDPITLTGSNLGRMAVLINANDVAVTGVRPRWFLVTAMLPVGTTEDGVRELFVDLRTALAKVGAALVGGHTEITPAVVQPVVVGQMLGTTRLGGYVPTSGAQVGDTVVQVGAAPVEAGSVLAVEAADRLDGLDKATVLAAAAAIEDPGISVVEPALAAAELGATSLHDPTEGGLAGGLHELATASGAALSIDPDRVVWHEACRAVCDALGADPWAALASGTLLATFTAASAPSAVAALEARGHVTAVIGTVEFGSGVHTPAGAPIPFPLTDELARILT